MAEAIIFTIRLVTNTRSTRLGRMAGLEPTTSLSIVDNLSVVRPLKDMVMTIGI